MDAKNFNQQLELNFDVPKFIHHRIVSASDRILKAWHEQKKSEYYREIKSQRRDRFFSFGGVALY